MKNLLVTIPHASMIVPPAIDVENVDPKATADIVLSVDTGTDIIYALDDVPRFVFPYCRAFVDVKWRIQTNSWNLRFLCNDS